MAKTGLGRGLGSLLGARPSATPSEPAEAPPEPTPAEDSPAGPGEVPVGEILPGAMQPRTGFDDESLNELAESIRENGIMQPLVVRPREGGYELIAGERRSRASQMAGLAKVPVGLFGLATQTIRVSGVIALSIAGRSCPYSIAGTALTFAPIIIATSG